MRATVDRMVRAGMPSETWGMRARRCGRHGAGVKRREPHEAAVRSVACPGVGSGARAQRERQQGSRRTGHLPHEVRGKGGTRAGARAPGGGARRSSNDGHCISRALDHRSAVRASDAQGQLVPADVALHNAERTKAFADRYGELPIDQVGDAVVAGNQPPGLRGCHPTRRRCGACSRRRAS